MKRIYTIVQVAAAVTILGTLLTLPVSPRTDAHGGPQSVLALLGLERTSEASLIKYVLGSRTCSQENTREVNDDEVPGAPPGGGWVAKEDCEGNENSRCIDCHDEAADSTEEAGSDNGSLENQIKTVVDENGDVLKISSGCGWMYAGRCMRIGGVMRCELTTGSYFASCKEVSRFKRQPQPIPSDPVDL